MVNEKREYKAALISLKTKLTKLKSNNGKINLPNLRVEFLRVRNSAISLRKKSPSLVSATILKVYINIVKVNKLRFFFQEFGISGSKKKLLKEVNTQLKKLN